jgi:hypothetical protein
MAKLRRDEEVSLTKVIDVVCKIIDEVSFAGTDSVMHGTIKKWQNTDKKLWKIFLMNL